ncbi:MAG: hypothetical protein SGJ09_13270 [Phycisphaerae bacterium]|nr:hypothetical protein [Phycisphaerae bacterium]
MFSNDSAPTRPRPSHPRTIARRQLAGIAAALIGTLASLFAAASPADITRQLFRGKLVSVSFHRRLPVLARPQLAFLLFEEFSLTFAEPGRDLVTGAPSTSTDLAALTPSNYADTIRALLPPGVELGSDCLVEIHWEGVDRNVVSVEPASADSRVRFIAKNFDFLQATDRHFIDTAPSGAQLITSSAIIFARNNRAAASQATDDADRVQLRLEALTKLLMASKMLEVRIQSLDRATLRLNWRRDAASESQRAEIDALITPAAESTRALTELLASLATAVAEDPPEELRQQTPVPTRAGAAVEPAHEPTKHDLQADGLRRRDAWGTTDFFPDLDRDGTVGPSDLGALLGAWTLP